MPSLAPILQASGTILNPYYEFPCDRTTDIVRIGGEPEKAVPKPKIVEPCRITFPNYGLVLLFNDTTIIFRFDTDERGRQLLDPLLSYISFESFLNYNISSATVISDADINQLPEVERILFNLGRIVRKEAQTATGRSFWYDCEPCQLVVEKKEIGDFLDIINIPLFAAIYYYLTGCANSEYFLIEFYKSIEAIRNYFKNEDTMKQKLKPFGFNTTDFKKLKKYANDELEPLNIGRHAPKRYDKLVFVNVKRLLVEPKSKEVYEESTRICRAMIEIFIRYLKSTR